MILESKILVCYNEPTRYYSNYIGKNFAHNGENIDLSESEFLKELELVKHTLKREFAEIELLALNRDVQNNIKAIQRIDPTIVFNFVESIEGNSNFESFVAGLFDLLEIQYTGNSALCLGNCLNKSRTKQILKSFNIPTPDYCIAEYKKSFAENDFELKFPVILKLIHEDASIGISEFSVVNDFKSLKKRLDFLFNHYKQDVLIEEYIVGRELNISIFGNQILPISEIIFEGLPSELPKIITYEAKWSPETVYYKHTSPRCPSQLDEKLRLRIEDVAMQAYTAMECRDYARVDIRLNKRNNPYVIEVNPNPDISTDSGFVRSAAAAGISYDEILFRLTHFAIKRKEIIDDTPIDVEGQKPS